MFYKLALGIFLFMNGGLQGPLGVAVVDTQFPTEQACRDFAASDDGKKIHMKVDEFAKSKFGATATAVDECVPLSPADVPKSPAPQNEPAVLPSRPGQRGA